MRALGGSAAVGGTRGYHPQKRAPQSGDWFHRDVWMAFNSIQHWPEDQLAVIQRDWNATPAKPTWLFEGRYEGYYKNNSAMARVPVQSLLAGDDGKADRLTSDRVTATWLPDGHLAMFYTASGRPIRVRMDKLSGPLNAWWFNPRTGRWHVNGVESVEMKPFAEGIAAGPGTAERAFEPPGGSGAGIDWVLVLCRNAALY